MRIDSPWSLALGICLILNFCFIRTSAAQERFIVPEDFTYVLIDEPWAASCPGLGTQCVFVPESVCQFRAEYEDGVCVATDAEADDSACVICFELPLSPDIDVQ